MVTKHINLSVSGRVQGVGFRYGAKEKAEKFGISGFAENRGGGVYIEAEGTEKNLEKFIAWCRKGPMWADVDNVEISEGTVQAFKGFEVR
jgi:acylphosphatase